MRSLLRLYFIIQEAYLKFIQKTHFNVGSTVNAFERKLNRMWRCRNFWFVINCVGPIMFS